MLEKQVFVVAITCIKCVVLQLIHSTSDSRVTCGNIIIYILNCAFLLIINDINFDDVC